MRDKKDENQYYKTMYLNFKFLAMALRFALFVFRYILYAKRSTLDLFTND